MISATVYALFIVLVIGPALLGIKQLKEWREGQGSLGAEQKALIGGLFAPAAFFLVFVLFYVMAMYILLARQ